MAQYHGDLSRFSQPAYRADNGRSLAIALLCLFFLGYLGIHRFYIGMAMSGLAQLLLSTFGIVIVAVAISGAAAAWLFDALTLWLVADFVMLLIMFR